MWKDWIKRRLRATGDTPVPQAPARPTIDNPFADLMEKLDRIPYRPERRPALGR